LRIVPGRWRVGPRRRVPGPRRNVSCTVHPLCTLRRDGGGARAPPAPAPAAQGAAPAVDGGNMRRSMLRNHFVQFTLPVVLALSAGPVAAAVCRVAPAGVAAAEGASWASPTTLHAALDRSACTELWLAAGVYLPGAAGDR